MKKTLMSIVLGSFISLVSSCGHQTNVSPVLNKPQEVQQSKIYETLSTNPSHRPERGDPPQWYSSPTTYYHRCAINICEKYPNACYYDCLTLAKRILDAFEGNIKRAENRCNNLPKKLLFVVDTTRERCDDYL